MDVIKKWEGFATIHRERLLEAMGSGFLAPPKDDGHGGVAHSGILQVVAKGAGATLKTKLAEGDLGVLLELEFPPESLLDSGDEGHGVRYPIPISVVTRASFPDSQSLKEFRALAESFPDIVATAIESTSSEAGKPPTDPVAAKSRRRQPSDSVQLGLSVAPTLERNASELKVSVSAFSDPSGVEKVTEAQLKEIRNLDKMGGLITGLVWGAPRTGRGVSQLAAALKGLGAIDEPSKNVVAQVLESTVLGLLPDAEYASDRLLLSATAKQLCNSDSVDGLDPAAFLLETVSDALKGTRRNSALRKELEEFREGAAGVLSSKLELKPDSLADAAHIGSRALLLFMLNPSVDILERFLKRRPGTGPTVAFLAKALVGLFTGLAALPRELKSRPTNYLRSLAEQLSSHNSGRLWAITETQGYYDSGGALISLLLGGHSLLEVEISAAPEIAQVRDHFRAIDMELQVDPSKGSLSAVRTASGRRTEVGLRFLDSCVRLPIKRCIELSVTLDAPPTPASKGHDSTLVAHGPVQVRRTPDSCCSVEIEWEGISPNQLSDGVDALEAYVVTLAKGAPEKRRLPRPSRSKKPPAPPHAE